MSARLFRMVIRVSPTLRPTLGSIADRLLTETGLDYSHSAIVRALIAIGLLTVADAPHLAPLFMGTRIQRGRKKGDRVR